MATLAANASATQERLKVSAIPAGDYFQIDDEIVRVIDKRTTQLTILVERAYAGTTAATHNSGATLTPLYVPSTGGGESQEQIILSITVTLTDAQVKASPTTPFEVLPAPGADKVILPIAAYLILHTPNYDNYTNIDALVEAGIRWRDGGSSSDAIFDHTLDNGDLLAANYPRTVQPLSVNGSVVGGAWLPFPLGWDDAPGVNASLEFFMTNGAAGNFTGGNAANSLDVLVLYAVIDV